MMKKWKIYYSVSTFNDEQGSPREAPFWDVQDIIQFDLHTERKYHQNGSDWYIFQNGFWVGVDMIGLIDYLAHYEGEIIVKAGRTIPSKQWQKIFDTARKDPYIK
jgi:hypothetical protein